MITIPAGDKDTFEELEHASLSIYEDSTRKVVGSAIGAGRNKLELTIPLYGAIALLAALGQLQESGSVSKDTSHAIEIIKVQMTFSAS